MTLDKIALGKEYENKALSYERLTKEVKIILDEGLKKESLDIFPTTPRVKKAGEFLKKIVRKGITADFFNKIDDIAGVRIICRYYSQLEIIGKIITKEFKIVREDRKTTFNRIDQFGYLSDHYIVKLKETSTKQTEKDLLDLKCEIQVRTLLMHSWATVSHELDYKKDEILEEDIRREMYAISGLLYVADQRFDSFRNSMLEKINKTVIQTEPEFDHKQNITPDKMIQYLENKFPDREIGKTSDYIQLIEELAKMNYNDFENLNSIINKTKDVLQEYEKKYPPNSKTMSKYDRVGAVRICIGIGDTIHDKNNNYYIIDVDEYRKKISN